MTSEIGSYEGFLSGRTVLLGDAGTARHADALTAEAAERGARIAEIFTFDKGEATSRDDIATVDAVVAALARAIAIGADVWVSFPAYELYREQHARRIALVLGRHGRVLRLGRSMSPYPTHGVNAIDSAVMRELRAVDQLHNAALGAAGVLTLSAEIELALKAIADRSPALPAVVTGRDESDHKTYTTARAAALIGKSARWLQRGLRDGRFTYTDGTRIEPIRQERGHQFTIPLLRAIARSAWRRGSITTEHLDDVLAKLSVESAR